LVTAAFISAIQWNKVYILSDKQEFSLIINRLLTYGIDCIYAELMNKKCISNLRKVLERKQNMRSTPLPPLPSLLSPLVYPVLR